MTLPANCPVCGARLPQGDDRHWTPCAEVCDATRSDVEEWTARRTGRVPELIERLRRRAEDEQLAEDLLLLFDDDDDE